MALRYNSPPNWPAPPPGWTPPKGWKPDPSWGPAPTDWRFWVDDATVTGEAEVPGGNGPSTPPSFNTKRNWFARHKALTAIGAAVLLITAMASLINGVSDAPTAAPPPATTAPAETPAASATRSTSSTPPSPRPTPTPTQRTSSASEAPPVAKPSKYSGRGNKILKIKKPSEGASLITLTHSGESNFIVYQLNSSLKEDENLVNAIGDYKGSTILDLAGNQETSRLKMLPGATKYGDNEYSISKKAITQDFYIESSCGDPDYTGEVAYFGGKIPKKAR